MLLPLNFTRDEYFKLKKDSSVWLPAIQSICQKHGLFGEPVQSKTGSHIVYRVGDVWLKLMAPMFKHDMKYELAGLRSVARLKEFNRPKILFTGEIEDWFYVALSHVGGLPIRECWSQFDRKTKLDMAKQIAQLVNALGKCESDPDVVSRFDWNPFVTGQKKNAVRLHGERGLTKSWTDGLDIFLDQFPIEEFLFDHPVFMHADLQFDHLLIDLGSAPKVSGIIDLADCQTGHPYYELGALMVFVFKEDSEVIQEFIKHLDFGRSFPKLTSERIMAWCMVHRYFTMTPLFGSIMAEFTPGDFAGLSRRLFPL